MPLSRQVLKLLHRRRLRSAALNSPWVFPQERVPIGGHVSVSAIRREAKTAGYDTTVHGLRSSFKAWALDAGVPREVSEFALGHCVDSAVERAYSHGTDLFDRRKEVMQLWSDLLRLDTLIGGVSRLSRVATHQVAQTKHPTSQSVA